MTDTSDSEYVAPKGKPPKEILVVQDHGFFTHETGDTYEGFFEAKKKDRSVKMHGSGIYTTAQGDVYVCTWENDKISANEVAVITFTCGSKYEGFIKDWCYHGPGKYTYPDGTILTCNFAENCPVGDLVLTDPNGHTWTGKAQVGTASLEPNNHYYEILDKIREIKKIRRHKVKGDALPSERAKPEKKKVQLNIKPQ